MPSRITLGTDFCAGFISVIDLAEPVHPTHHSIALCLHCLHSTSAGAELYSDPPVPLEGRTTGKGGEGCMMFAVKDSVTIVWF